MPEYNASLLIFDGRKSASDFYQLKLINSTSLPKLQKEILGCCLMDVLCMPMSVAFTFSQRLFPWEWHIRFDLLLIFKKINYKIECHIWRYILLTLSDMMVVLHKRSGCYQIIKNHTPEIINIDSWFYCNLLHYLDQPKGVTDISAPRPHH